MRIGNKIGKNRKRTGKTDDEECPDFKISFFKPIVKGLSSMLIDTHAHLNFNAYKTDVDEVIQTSLNNNIWMVNVGSQYQTSKRAVEIAQKYEKGVYAAVGLHPIHLDTGLVKIKYDPEETEKKLSGEHFDVSNYQNLAKSSKKVVAIGEIGLDYYWKPKTKKKLVEFKEKQRNVLCQQLTLAKELNLPVIFHCRMAHDDLIETLKQYQNSKEFTMVYSLLSGVVHCFTGSWEQAKKYLEMGLYLGFNGLIFKPAPYRTCSGAGMDSEEIIKKIPLEKILIETDCPYLTPPLPAEALAKAGPMTGRNEPLYLKYIAEKIAKIKKLSYGEIVETTTKNARKLFKI